MNYWQYIRQVAACGPIDLLKGIKFELLRNRQFQRLHAYPLNLSSPQTFSEKIYFRKYHGNNKVMARFADKYAVREYVSQRIGEQYLIPLLGVYDQVTEADLEALPNQFVIKTNHGSGSEHIEIVADKAKADLPRIARKMNQALKLNKGLNGHELFYLDIERKLIVEEYLDMEGSLTPDDYKFHCFGGETLFIQVDEGRYGLHRRNIFDEHWGFIDMKIGPHIPHIPHCPRPPQLEEMVRLAKALAQDFDYVRVDLYALKGQIYFGEITQTAGCGEKAFVPVEKDREWGALWQLDKHDPALYSYSK